MHSCHIDSTDPPTGDSGRLSAAQRRIGLHAPWLTVALWIVALGAAAVVSTDVGSSLSPAGGFTDPSSDSARAAELARDDARLADPNVFVIITASIDSEPSVALRNAGAAVERRVSTSGTIVDSFLRAGGSRMASVDGRSGMIAARLIGDADEVHELVGSLVIDLGGIEDGLRGVVQIDVGGSAVIDHATIAIAKSDLARAEMIAAPLLLVLFVLIFRSVVAALLALAVGASAVVFTTAALRWIGDVTAVSAFALNLTTALGLGLAVDYSLLVITRYRSERENAVDLVAIERTLRTAGRTVLFGAMTTAAALSALFVFPIAYLRSFAIAGVAVVLIALAVSLVVLPALLVILGDRLDRFTVPSRRGHRSTAVFFASVGTRVTRRPIVIAAATITVLLLLGAPFTGVTWGAADDRSLPGDADARIAHEALREQFPATALSTAIVIGLVEHDDATSRQYFERVTRLDEVGALAERISITDDESGVAFAFVAVAADPSIDGVDLVAALRSVEGPSGVVVGGVHAEALDTQAGIRRRLPLAVGLMLASTLGMLAIAFRSVVVPLKAVVVNALSLTAAFGAVVWIFQDGNLSSPLGFTATGVTEVTTPILMFCVAFGLSIDYEVILLSAIRERWMQHGDNRRSVIEGLGSSARIITASALLLIVVFATFATSGITMVKLFGIGLAAAIFIDATLVRLLLAPSLMSLAGDRNWWPTRRPVASGESDDTHQPHRSSPTVTRSARPETDDRSEHNVSATTTTTHDLEVTS